MEYEFAHGIALRLMDLLNFNPEVEGSFIYGLEGPYDLYNSDTNMIYRFEYEGDLPVVSYSVPIDGRVRHYRIDGNRDRDEPFNEIIPPIDLKG